MGDHRHSQAAAVRNLGARLKPRVVPVANPFKVEFYPLSNLAVDTWGCLEF